MERASALIDAGRAEEAVALLDADTTGNVLDKTVLAGRALADLGRWDEIGPRFAHATQDATSEQLVALLHLAAAQILAAHPPSRAAVLPDLEQALGTFQRTGNAPLFLQGLALATRLYLLDNDAEQQNMSSSDGGGSGDGAECRRAGRRYIPAVAAREAPSSPREMSPVARWTDSHRGRRASSVTCFSKLLPRQRQDPPRLVALAPIRLSVLGPISPEGC